MSYQYISFYQLQTILKLLLIGIETLYDDLYDAKQVQLNIIFN